MLMKLAGVDTTRTIPVYGTCRATHYRKKAAKGGCFCSFVVTLRGLVLEVVYGTDDEVEAPSGPCDGSVIPVYCTCREAFEKLKKAQVFFAKCTSRIKENWI